MKRSSSLAKRPLLAGVYFAIHRPMSILPPFRGLTRVVVSLIVSLSIFEYPQVLFAAPSMMFSGQVEIESLPTPGAVVYLEPLDVSQQKPKPQEYTIRQERISFQPQFSVVTVGSSIRFENHDQEIHNVKSNSPSNRFDVGAHLPGTVKTVYLKRPGAVPLRCKVHQEMKGLIFVSPFPYFAVTDAEGRFHVSDIPLGKYQLEVWHPRLSTEEVEQSRRQLTLKQGDQAIILKVRAQASAGANLVEAESREWLSIVDEIQLSLSNALKRWEAGKRRSAMTKVMTTLSGGFTESGLRAAIAGKFGEDRAREHEQHFDEIRKQVQGLGSDTTTEPAIRKKIESLISDLSEDAQAL